MSSALISGSPVKTRACFTNILLFSLICDDVLIGVKVRDQNQALNSQALPVWVGGMELDQSCVYFHPGHVPVHQAHHCW